MTTLLPRICPPLVPQIYPGDLDSKNERDEDSDDSKIDDDDRSYYGSITNPEDISDIPTNDDFASHIWLEVKEWRELNHLYRALFLVHLPTQCY